MLSAVTSLNKHKINIQTGESIHEWVSLLRSTFQAIPFVGETYTDGKRGFCCMWWSTTPHPHPSRQRPNSRTEVLRLLPLNTGKKEFHVVRAYLVLATLMIIDQFGTICENASKIALKKKLP